MFIHAAIHRIAGKACVLHTHMPYATALTLTVDRGLDTTLSQNAMRFHGRVAIDAHYNGLALDASRGRAHRRARWTAPTWRSSATTAWWCAARAWTMAYDDLYYLERACMAQVLAQSTGRPLLPVDAAIGRARARPDARRAAAVGAVLRGAAAHARTERADDVTALHVAALRQRLRGLGAQPVHEERVLRQWARAESQANGRRRPEDFLPRSLREALPALEAELHALAVLRADHAGADGARRLLVGLGDGRSVEAVLLPRGGLCVSSQVGCAVGCVFCMTGIGGLERQLGSAEIVAQVALARRLRPVTKVVFMGMGEPAHNLEDVLEAIDLLGTGGGIGHKQLVFSTVGDRRVFERLPHGPRQAGARALAAQHRRGSARAPAAARP